MKLIKPFQLLKDVWNFRSLLFQLTLRDLRVRYKQTALGFAWAIIQPLILMLIFCFVFKKVLLITTPNQVPYAVLALVGLIPWTFFSSYLTSGVSSLTNHASLISKIYFPRVLLPISMILSATVDFLISSLILIVLFIYYHIHPSPSWLLLIPLFTIQILLMLGIVFILSALHVKYRDVRYILPLILQMWMFLTPIFYSSDLVPRSVRFFYMLNPMAFLVDAYQKIIVTHQLAVNLELFAALAITPAIFTCGYLYFRNMEKWFSEII